MLSYKEFIHSDQIEESRVRKGAGVYYGSKHGRHKASAAKSVQGALKAVKRARAAPTATALKDLTAATDLEAAVKALGAYLERHEKRGRDLAEGLEGLLGALQNLLDMLSAIAALGVTNALFSERQASHGTSSSNR